MVVSRKLETVSACHNLLMEENAIADVERMMRKKILAAFRKKGV